MSFLSSILFGSEGSYKILGQTVNFKRDPEQEDSSLISKSLWGCIAQGYVQTVVHEMGHALAVKLFKEQATDKEKDTYIEIFTNILRARTIYCFKKSPSRCQTTIHSLAGPMASITFSTCKLFAAAAFSNYLTRPFTVTLGVQSIVYINLELLVMCVSACAKDDGDFGKIARLGNLHLTLATAAIISELALGFFVLKLIL